MALYLVVHTPRAETEEAVRPPTRLRELALASDDPTRSPRWLRAWSPDLHDDRIFSLWEAKSAAEVRAALQEFGFLSTTPRPPHCACANGVLPTCWRQMSAEARALSWAKNPHDKIAAAKRARLDIFASRTSKGFPTMTSYSVVGQRVRRIDAPAKLTGQERFTGDLRVPGMLYARPVTSPYAHARIGEIDARRALQVPGVVRVLAAGDLPVVRDANGMPVKAPIAAGEAVYAGQFVALVLAESDAAAQDGVAAVEVAYEPLPVVTTLDAALDPSSPHIRETRQQANDEEAGMHNADAAIQAEENDQFLPANVSNSVHFTRGDAAAGFAAADEIVEFTVESQPVHQGYLEPQVCFVDIEPLGDLTVYTSTQAAFYCRTKVAETVGLPVQRINVVPMPVGGGFGGKFVFIEPLVAAMALASRRPVLLQYSRMDDFLAGNPAPDCRIGVKLGATRDGYSRPLEGNLVYDTGSSGGSPMQIAAILLGGYYRFPNLEIRGSEVLTNKPGAGAYRAPGAQQPPSLLSPRSTRWPAAWTSIPCSFACATARPRATCGQRRRLAAYRAAGVPAGSG